MNNEQNSTSTSRILPHSQVSKPVYINFSDLESIRETELAKRRERAQDFQFRNW